MYLSSEYELLIEEIQQFLDNADHFKQINRQTLLPMLPKNA